MRTTNMKRFVIILSLVVVLLAGAATAVIIIRARAARLAVPGGTPSVPTNGTTENEPSKTPGTSSSSKTEGIVPREEDAPPLFSETSQKDSDGDGLIDGEESALRTDPNRKDTVSAILMKCVPSVRIL